MERKIIVARVIKGQFCLEAMKNIERGYDGVESDNGELVYFKNKVSCR